VGRTVGVCAVGAGEGENPALPEDNGDVVCSEREVLMSVGDAEPATVDESGVRAPPSR
jgi:hypothetical protein